MNSIKIMLGYLVVGYVVFSKYCIWYHVLCLGIFRCFMVLGCGMFVNGGESRFFPHFNSVDCESFFWRFGDDVVGLW